MLIFLNKLQDVSWIYTEVSQLIAQNHQVSTIFKLFIRSALKSKLKEKWKQNVKSTTLNIPYIFQIVILMIDQ